MFVDPSASELFKLVRRDFQALGSVLRNKRTFSADGLSFLDFKLTIPVSKRLDEDVLLRFKYGSANLTNPNRPPDVYLISHRETWKNLEDSHIEGDWRLCLFPKGLSYINYSNPDGPLRLLCSVSAFLCRQYIYQKLIIEDPKASWPGKGFDHGAAGLEQAKRLRKNFDPGSLCFCGSGIELRYCKQCY